MGVHNSWCLSLIRVSNQVIFLPYSWRSWCSFGYGGLYPELPWGPQLRWSSRIWTEIGPSIFSALQKLPSQITGVKVDEGSSMFQIIIKNPAAADNLCASWWKLSSTYDNHKCTLTTWLNIQQCESWDIHRLANFKGHWTKHYEAMKLLICLAGMVTHLLYTHNLLGRILN